MQNSSGLLRCHGNRCLQAYGLVSQEDYWPLFLALVVIPTFIQLMLLPWFPESPRYLLIEKHNVHATITGEFIEMLTVQTVPTELQIPRFPSSA